MILVNSTEQNTESARASRNITWPFNTFYIPEAIAKYLMKLSL
jgi:hypothetical protein